MVKDAVRSFLNSSYPHKKLYILDDGSDVPISDVLDEMPEILELSPRNKQDILVFRVTPDLKAGLIENKKVYPQGIYSNVLFQNMFREGCGVALVLCDDDLLFPDYLTQLAYFYTFNEKCTHACCFSYPFEDNNIPDDEVSTSTFCNYLFNIPIQAVADQITLDYVDKSDKNKKWDVLDISQASYRLSSVIEGDITWVETANSCLDFQFQNDMIAKYGPFTRLPIWGQKKRFHPLALAQSKTPDDLDSLKIRE